MRSKIVLSINSFVSIVSIGWAVAVLFDSSLLSASTEITAGELFFARMYVVRAIPLGLTAGILPFFAKEQVIVTVLIIAILAQIGDCMIGISSENSGMIGGSCMAAAGYFCSTLYFIRRGKRL